MAEAQSEKKSGRGLSILVVVLALLGVGAFVAYQFLTKENWAFSYHFDGCDEAGKCGEFELYAPGNHWAWVKDESNIVSDPGPKEFAKELGGRLKAAKGVIAVGLASSEGSSEHNRKLTACRSLILAGVLSDARGYADSSAEVYRVPLGRYTDEQTEFSGTHFQRNAVFVFIEKADDGVVLEEAIRAGLGPELRAELDAYGKRFDLGDPGKLDFRNYDCWENELKVTDGVTFRSGPGACFDETIAGFSC